MIRLIIILLSVVALFCYNSIDKNSHSNKPISIVFDEVLKVKKLKEDKNFEERNEVSVFLSDLVIEEKNGHEIKQWDFAKKKILKFEDSESHLSNDSIYADVVFRSMELSNRAVLLKMIKGANIKADGLEDVALLEHLFSMKYKQGKGGLELSKFKDNGIVSYSVGDKEIFSYSTKHLTKLSAKESELFLKFLRYNYGVHPDILQDLGQKEILPDQITIKHYEIHQNREILLSLKSFSRDVKDYWAFTLQENSSSKNLKSDSLSALINKANALPKGELEKRRQQILDRAINYAKNKKYLPAATSFFAYSSSIGGEVPKEFNDYKNDLLKDQNVQKLISTLGSKDSNKAISILDSLVKKAGEDSYLLLAFKANYLKAENRSQSTKLFQEALSENNIMPNIWIDLGKNLIYEFRTYEAWECFDVAKKLTPNHPMLSEIYKKEKDVEMKYPEFF